MDDLAVHLSSQTMNNTQKCLIVLACLGRPAPTGEIKKVAFNHGLRAAKDWNVNALLRARPGRAALTDQGWKILPDGREYISEAGFSLDKLEFQEVSSPIRDLVQSVDNSSYRTFLSEAAVCFDNQCYRASVIMSWCAALEALKKGIIEPNLKLFCDSFAAAYPNSKTRINSLESLEDVRENDIVAILGTSRLISRTLQKQLFERLNLRNAAGHPNSVIISRLVAAAHIELLIQNVILKLPADAT